MCKRNTSYFLLIGRYYWEACWCRRAQCRAYRYYDYINYYNSRTVAVYMLLLCVQFSDHLLNTRCSRYTFYIPIYTICNVCTLYINYARNSVHFRGRISISPKWPFYLWETYRLRSAIDYAELFCMLNPLAHTILINILTDMFYMKYFY